MTDLNLDTSSPHSDERRPIVVLLVDDQPFVGAALGLLLRSETDIELHTCAWPLNAVALANQIAPTVILQDLVMPDVAGLTLVRLYRTNPATSGTPVIVLSANDDAGWRARALAEGAQGYLVKLPRKTELIACIREHAARSAGGAATLDFKVIEGFRDIAEPDFTRGLVNQFVQEATERVSALKHAAGRSDVHQLNAVAHSLKGSSMIMGATRLAALCGQVEDQVAVPPGHDVAPALIMEIEQEFSRVEQALGVETQGLSEG